MKRVTGSAGTYHVVREIGRGSYAVVHLARLSNGKGHDTADAALKYFPAGFHDSAEDEAARVPDVAHPGVVKLIEIIAPTHDAGLQAIIAMSAASTNLASLLRKGVVSGCLAREWSIQLAAAVAHVHAKRVVHRDIKPGNVLAYFDSASVEGAGFVKAHVWLAYVDMARRLPGIYAQVKRRICSKIVVECMIR